MIDANAVWVELNRKILVSANTLKSLKLNELSTAMAVIQETSNRTQKPVEYVNSLTELANAKNLRDAVTANCPHVAERVELVKGEPLLDAEIGTLKLFAEAQRNLLSMLDNMAEVPKQMLLGSYKLTEVLSQDEVARVQISSRTIQYRERSIGVKEFEKLWERLRAHWAKKQRLGTYEYAVRAGGARHWVDVRDSSGEVHIGCVRIPRYIIEQTALKLSLSFADN